MEDYYDVTLVTYIQGKGEVLNAQGGVEFAKGIAGLNIYRPELFAVVITQDMIEWTEGNTAFDDATTWRLQIGETVADTMDNIGDLFSIDGRGLLQIIMALLMITGFLITRNVLGGFAVSTLIALVFMYLRVLDAAYFVLIAAIMIFVLAYQLWFSK
jgi:hypothetical protein